LSSGLHSPNAWVAGDYTTERHVVRQWPAVVGRHDGNGATSTLAFLDHPENSRFPTRWFVRDNPYAGVSCAFSFDEEPLRDPAATFTLRFGDDGTQVTRVQTADSRLLG